MARENLKAARKRKGMTQAQVAKALGVTERYYQFIESGERDGSVKFWDAAEGVFGVSQQKLRAKPGRSPAGSRC